MGSRMMLEQRQGTASWELAASSVGSWGQGPGIMQWDPWRVKGGWVVGFGCVSIPSLDSS